ncbi:NAD-dependent epimerase/dehydratase family protein [Fluviispira vulneris]|uniref:NAD-dependent epimerase/dehydratase family protein n=1 Tax=Fluviispira vulneris TaxID=2763012 RepID=UPI001647B5DF|nr:NAD(P)-dependent oxidoreductase [Fluviispira vulneris]
MKKDIVILGSSGFIAKAFIKSILNKNFNITAIHRSNIEDKYPGISYQNVMSYLEAKIPQNSIVFHFAETADKAEVNKQGFSYIKRVEEQVLYFLSKKPIRFIYTSSTSVYNDQSSLYLNPDSILSEPNDVYSRAKVLVENIVKRNNGVILRLSNIFGSGMSNRNIFSNILSQIHNSEIILNDSSSERDYLWIDDLLSALYHVAIKEATGVFNVASGKSISVESLCKLILTATNKEHLQIKYRFPPCYSSIKIDISKTTECFNWIPKTNILDGIHKLIGDMSEK